MKKILLTLAACIALAFDSMAIYVDCGCAFPGPPESSTCYDVQLEYQGDGDCCHPVMGYGTNTHLDCVTGDPIGSGTPIHNIDAALVCEDRVGPPSC